MVNEGFLFIRIFRILCWCLFGVILLRAFYMGIKHRNKLANSFFIIYIFVLIMSFIFVITGILSHKLQKTTFISTEYIILMHYGSYYSFFTLLAWQVFMKLNTAFIGTIYNLSKCKSRFIGTLLVFQVLCGIINLILYKMSPEISQLCVLIAFAIYNGVSIYMVILFIRTLFKLMENTENTCNDTMIKGTIIYIVTSSVAYSSSILMGGISFIFLYGPSTPINFQIAALCVIIDALINLIAIYLQYNFAENDYDKCCILCHNCVFKCIQRYHRRNKSANDMIIKNNKLDKPIDIINIDSITTI